MQIREYGRNINEETRRKQKWKLLKKYLEELSILKGDFTLSSGKKSDYYIDARICSLSSKPLALISKIFFDLIKKSKSTYLGGPTIGADPIVGGILVCAAEENYNLKGFLVRSIDKDHGTKKIIEGPTIENATITLVEDVVSTGGSLIKAIDRLEDQGLRISNILSIVDREMNARSKFLERNISYNPLFTISELI